MTRDDRQRVLVLDGHHFPTLAIVRSLGRRGLAVDLGSPSEGSYVATSKYCADRFRYPHPFSDLPAFKAAILDRVRRYPYALVIPISEETVPPLMEIRESVEQYARVGLAANDAMAVALSKSRTCELAGRLALPIPKTWIVKAGQPLPAMEGEIGYPVVVKPDRKTVWSQEGRGRVLSVQFASSRADLEEIVSRLSPFGRVVLQEFVAGRPLMVGLLAVGGEIALAYQHRSLHSVPPWGGTGCYRETEPLDHRVLPILAPLMKALAWDGVANVEMRQREDTGTLCIGEINARFWGSIALPVAAGADFPFYLFDWKVNRRLDVPTTYQVGVRSRHLSLDLVWLEWVLRNRRELARLRKCPTYWRIFADTIRIFNPFERIDTLDPRDPRPALQEVTEIARGYAYRVWTQLRRRLRA